MSVVRLLHVSDTHIAAGVTEGSAPLADVVHTLSGRTTSETLHTVLEATEAVGFQPDLVLHTGDVVDAPDPRSYDEASRLLGQVVAPALVVPGNHDDPDMLAAVFGEKRMAEIGAWVIVGLSSRVDGAGHGRVADDTLLGLDELLSATDAHVLIGLHHPPLSPCGHPYCRLENSYELISLLDRHRHVRAVLSGHLHMVDEVERRQVRYLLGPSTCIQLRHHHPLPEHNRSATKVGVRLLHLQADGDLQSEIVWASPE